MTPHSFVRRATNGPNVLLAVGACALVSSVLFAEPNVPLNAFEVCERIESDADQLACFRATLARLQAGESAASLPPEEDVHAHAEQPVTGGPGDDHEESVQEQAVQEFGLYDMNEQITQGDTPNERVASPAESATRESHEKSAAPQDLHAIIVDVRRTAYGKIVAMLDNGQVWQETDGSYYRGTVRAGTAVVIARRRFGGYEMKVGAQPGVVPVRRSK